MRALVLTVDGEPEGIIGISRSKGVLTLFSQFQPALEPYLKKPAVLRAGFKVMNWVKASRQMVISHAQHDEGHRLLTRVGFEQMEKDLYLWPG